MLEDLTCRDDAIRLFLMTLGLLAKSSILISTDSDYIKLLGIISTFQIFTLFVIVDCGPSGFDAM
jgi:hypothetical protein